MTYIINIFAEIDNFSDRSFIKKFKIKTECTTFYVKNFIKEYLYINTFYYYYNNVKIYRVSLGLEKKYKLSLYDKLYDYDTIKIYININKRNFLFFKKFI